MRRGQGSTDRGEGRRKRLGPPPAAPATVTARLHWGRRSGLRVTVAICAAGMTPSVALAAEHWMISNVPAYYQGHYGTAHPVGILYDPTDIQYQRSPLRIKLSIPYVSVVNLPKGAWLSGADVVARTPGPGVRTASGLGDIWLAGHYTLIPERGLRPAWVPYVKIKFATARAAQGLGTGRNDYEAGLGLRTTIGANVFPFAHVGYRFVGSPPGVRLRDIATYDAGVSIATRARDVVTVFYAGAQSEQPGLAGPSDVIGAWNYRLTRAGSGLQVYLDHGLTSGSARLGGGLGVQWVF